MVVLAGKSRPQPNLLYRLSSHLSHISIRFFISILTLLDTLKKIIWLHKLKYTKNVDYNSMSIFFLSFFFLFKKCEREWVAGADLRTVFPEYKQCEDLSRQANEWSSKIAKCKIAPNYRAEILAQWLVNEQTVNLTNIQTLLRSIAMERNKVWMFVKFTVCWFTNHWVNLCSN